MYSRVQARSFSPLHPYKSEIHVKCGRIDCGRLTIAISIAIDIVTATTWHHHTYCQLLLDICIVYMPAFWIPTFRTIARTGKLRAHTHIHTYTKKNGKVLSKKKRKNAESMLYSIEIYVRYKRSYTFGNESAFHTSFSRIVLYRAPLTISP